MVRLYFWSCDLHSLSHDLPLVMWSTSPITWLPTAHVIYIPYHMISHWSCDLHPLSHDCPLLMWSTFPITWFPTDHVIYIPYHMIPTGHVVSTSITEIYMYTHSHWTLTPIEHWAVMKVFSLLARRWLNGWLAWLHLARCLCNFSIKHIFLVLWITYIVTVFSATGNPPGYHPCEVPLRNSLNTSQIP